MGNWNRRLPPGYRGDNSYPRRKMQRLMLRAIRKYQRSEMHIKTGIINTPQNVKTNSP